MSTGEKSDFELLEGFVDGDANSARQLCDRFDERLRRVVTPLPKAIAGLGLEEDVVQRTWELVFCAGREAYDATRGSVFAYLKGHAWNARRDVSAEHVPPGEQTRPRKDEEGAPVPWKSATPIDVPIVVTTGELVSLEEVLAAPGDEIERADDGVYVEELASDADRLGMSLVVDLIDEMREDRGLVESAAAINISRHVARRELDRFAAALPIAA